MADYDGRHRVEPAEHATATPGYQPRHLDPDPRPRCTCHPGPEATSRFHLSTCPRAAELHQRLALTAEEL